MLGRHCGSVKSTSAVYSRDLQASALAGLGDVVSKVRRGEFDPSAPRSLRWRPVVEVKSEAEAANVVSDEEAISLSESGTDVDHDLEEAAFVAPQVAPEMGVHVRHGLVCGSLVTANFVPVEGPADRVHHCGKCFRDVHRCAE